jgi:iron complex transport system substrate-binding protein
MIGVVMSGGSGRAKVESPAKLTVIAGVSTAVITWSSPYYEYMLVDGVYYYPVNAEGNSVFEIPVTLDEDMTIRARTVAMSQPHEIEYTMRFASDAIKPVNVKGSNLLKIVLLASPGFLIFTGLIIFLKQKIIFFLKQKKWSVFILLLFLIYIIPPGCADNAADAGSGGPGGGLSRVSGMELQFAENFDVEYYKGGYALITISDEGRFLVVPENAEAPSGIAEDITVLKRPVKNIYLAATSAMCLFDALDSLENIRFSGSRAEDWYIENAKTAMVSGNILYAGKYSAPDYELIMSHSCQLAIESTMINHAPEVKEKLEYVGIPVLTDQSSYESHPLGRTEWIKLYAVLVGKEAFAEQLFNRQAAYLGDVTGEVETEKTVAFFYISSSGFVIARKTGDYVTKMIELAGGDYIFKNLGDSQSASSTVTLEMETFYATAKEADFIIYNSAIDGEIHSLEELINKNILLKEFKAVQNGNVWCTGKNLYQETTRLGLMISDIRRMLTESGGNLTELNFMYKLR